MARRIRGVLLLCAMASAVAGCLERRLEGVQCLTARDCPSGWVCAVDAGLCVTADAAPADARPDDAVDAGPEPAPDAGPEPAPDAGPEPAPDAAPEPAPDAGPEPMSPAASVGALPDAADGNWADPCPVRWPDADGPPELIVLTAPRGAQPEATLRALRVAFARTGGAPPRAALCTIRPMDDLWRALGEPRAPAIVGPLEATRSGEFVPLVDGLGGMWIGPIDDADWTLAVPAAALGDAVGRLLRGRRMLLVGPATNPTLDAVEAACAVDGCPDLDRLQLRPDGSDLDPALLAGRAAVLLATHHFDHAQRLIDALKALPAGARPMLLALDDLPGTVAVDHLAEALVDDDDAACRVWSLTPYAAGPVPLEPEESRLASQLARLHDGVLLAGLALAARAAAGGGDADALDDVMHRVLAATPGPALRLDGFGWPEAARRARAGEALPPLLGAASTLPERRTGVPRLAALYAVRRGWVDDRWQVIERIPLLDGDAVDGDAVDGDAVDQILDPARCR